ncbi:bifunctional non-homologous end joining protein LigD [Actinoalloteichus hymeniacidonis]|uniref:non-homologous end-joining DNA ligase n=1 Tax=Actinoalloteichus hymeniacidonis TaxID=340345 RepID=UPI0017FFB43C|nr:non-homologous end-joining DNA ligase [Actinoalloteichus hymeniacidonis]MBB5907252.1 bifunctional non-homologous end joining protein LigD [Actinoalloteichus hymeniacidonis]
MPEASGSSRRDHGEQRRSPIRPMLASGGQPMPQAGPRWSWEFKFDGVRAIAVVEKSGRTRLISRNGLDVTSHYPELTVVGEVLDGRAAMLDGEIVALDEQGRPSFPLLQRRMHVAHPKAGLTAEIPVFYYLFDLLSLDGTELTAETYLRRRELLDDLGVEGRSKLVRVPPRQQDVDPNLLLDVARDNGLEGIIAKLNSSRYRMGERSRDWLKFPLLNTQEVVVGGWKPGSGSRADSVGSLILGAYDSPGVGLHYIGHVGTGFTQRMLADLLDRLRPLERLTSPFAAPVPREHARHARWVEPRLVGEVVFRTWSPDRRLRHSAWRGLRPDRDAAEIVVPAAQ